MLTGGRVARDVRWNAECVEFVEQMTTFDLCCRRQSFTGQTVLQIVFHRQQVLYDTSYSSLASAITYVCIQQTTSLLVILAYS